MQVEPRALEACEPLSKPKSGQDVDVVSWSVSTVLSYTDCSDKQQALAKAYTDTQKVKNETPKRAWFTWWNF